MYLHKLHPAIQARVDFFNTLEEDVKKVSEGNELRILYEKFGNYCINLGIGNAFGGHAYPNDMCDENFRPVRLEMMFTICSNMMTKKGVP